ncbi:hypothetical protein RB595_003130 [Gaeumannomyces hyphopodioides]
MSTSQTAAVASETTPLLASAGQDAPGSQPAQVPSPGPEQGAEPSPPASTQPRDIVALSRLSLLLSLLSAGLLVAFLAIYDAQDARDRPSYWWVHDCATNDVYLAFCAATLSGLNLLRLRRRGRLLWLGANLAADAALALYLAAFTAQSWSDALRDACDPRTKSSRCRDVAVVLRVLLIGGYILCFALALTHFVLAIKRLRAVWEAIRQAVVGRRDGWSVPAGQLTFEFTIKFLRQGERDGPRAAGEGAAAAAAAGGA